MKKTCFTIILMMWMFLGMTVAAEEPKETELYAQSAVLMDAQSGRVLYGKNEDQILAMASTTKIMTCIIALEYADVQEKVSVSAYASGMPKVKLGIRKGETYQLNDLLHSLMLESHNDAAVAIAEHVGKQFLPPGIRDKEVSEFTTEESKQAVAAFASLMNRKAAEIGCENTWFITPNGLDATESVSLPDGSVGEKFHSTTAEELARIMSYCILESPKSAQFLAITRAASHAFSSGGGRSFSCYNHNAFLTMMSGALSGKTGFTNQAGYCYVGALERDGRTFVVALLACGWPYNKNYKWKDTVKLMNYGLDEYHYVSFSTVEEKVEVPEYLEVLNGQTDFLGETARVEVQIVDVEGAQKGAGEDQDGQDQGGQDQTEQSPALQNRANFEGLLMRADEQIEVKCEWKEVLAAPVSAGERIGSVTYLVEGKIYKTQYIETVQRIPEIDFKWCLEKIVEFFLFL